VNIIAATAAVIAMLGMVRCAVFMVRSPFG